MKLVITLALIISMTIVGFLGYKSNLTGGMKLRAMARANAENLEKFKWPLPIQSPSDIHGWPIPQLCSLPNASKLFLKNCAAYLRDNGADELFIWGDSTAHAWLPVFYKIALDKKLRLTLISHPSCPPLLNIRKTEFPFKESIEYCSNSLLQKEILDYIREKKPKTVFLLGAWNSYSPYSKKEFITSDLNISADEETTKIALKTSIPLTILSISKYSKLVVFKSWPNIDFSVNTTNRYWWYKRSDDFSSMKSIKKNEFIKDSAFINQIFNETRNNRLVYFDPSELICDENTCSPYFKGVPMYLDGYHISPRGTLFFEGQLLHLHGGL